MMKLAKPRFLSISRSSIASFFVKNEKLHRRNRHFLDLNDVQVQVNAHRPIHDRTHFRLHFFIVTFQSTTNFNAHDRTKKRMSEQEMVQRDDFECKKSFRACISNMKTGKKTTKNDWWLELRGEHTIDAQCARDKLSKSFYCEWKNQFNFTWENQFYQCAPLHRTFFVKERNLANKNPFLSKCLNVEPKAENKSSNGKCVHQALWHGRAREKKREKKWKQIHHFSRGFYPLFLVFRIRTWSLKLTSFPSDECSVA